MRARLAGPSVFTDHAAAPAAAPSAPPAAPVTLHDLILGALQANLELQARRLDPPIQDSRVLAAWGAFDPVLSHSPLREQSERAQNQRDFLSTGQVARVFNEANNRYALSLAGRAPTGLGYELNLNHDQLDNTFNLSLPLPSRVSLFPLSVSLPAPSSPFLSPRAGHLGFRRAPCRRSGHVGHDVMVLPFQEVVVSAPEQSTLVEIVVK